MATTRSRPPSVEAFLGAYPEPVRQIAGRLRRLVRETVLDHLEAVYPGWKLVGYRVRSGARSQYFGFIAPMPDRVVLGFEYGVELSDPAGLLEGTGRQVRQVSFTEAARLDEALLGPLILEAALVAQRRKGRA